MLRSRSEKDYLARALFLLMMVLLLRLDLMLVVIDVNDHDLLIHELSG